MEGRKGGERHGRGREGGREGGKREGEGEGIRTLERKDHAYAQGIAYACTCT